MMAILSWVRWHPYTGKSVYSHNAKTHGNTQSNLLLLAYLQLPGKHPWKEGENEVGDNVED
jgi:hypothetical protein